MNIMNNMNNKISIFNGQSPSEHQRSYIEFYIQSEMVEKIYAFMEADPRIWVQFEWKNGLLWSSIDSKTIALTRTEKKKVCKEWKNVNVDFPDINMIAYGIVICREFGKENSEEILLDYISRYTDEEMHKIDF